MRTTLLTVLAFAAIGVLSVPASAQDERTAVRAEATQVEAESDGEAGEEEERGEAEATEAGRAADNVDLPETLEEILTVE